MSTSSGSPEGEGVRRRLLALLADVAGSAAVTGLLAGAGRDGPGTVVDAAPAPQARTPVSFLERVCELAVDEVGVSGAGITLMASVAGGIAGHRDQVCASDVLSRRLEDLQLTAGEGPCLEAYRTGFPVLVGDLDAQTRRWPGFGPDAVAAGAAAVFSLPLQVGAVRLGAFDLYRVVAGALAPERLTAALVLAGLITETLLERSEGPAGSDHGGTLLDAGWLSDVHAEVHVASGMTSVALGVGVAEALVRIRAHAYAQGEPIAEVAARIIARDLVLTDPDP